MRHLSQHRPTRAAAFLLCAVLSAASFWAGITTLSNWDDLWSGGDYYNSYSILQPMSAYHNRLYEALQLRQTKEWSGSLTYSEQERFDKLMAQLKPEQTNFRYQIHNESGRLIDDNLAGLTLEDAAVRVSLSTVRFTAGEELRRSDEYRTDPESGREFLYAYDGKDYVACDPADIPGGASNPYGYVSQGESWGGYNEGLDQRVHTENLVIEYGVHAPFEVRDDFWIGREDYEAVQQWLPLVAIGAGVFLTLAGGLMIFLCRGAGRRAGREEIILSRQDRIPAELYILLDFCLLAFLFYAMDSAAWSFSQYATLASFVGVSIFSCLAAGVLLAALITVVVRLKARRFWRSFWVVRLCGWFVGKLREGFDQWPMVWRAAALFLLYLAGTVLTGLTVFLIPVFQGFVLWHLCRWVKQWRTIRAGTEVMLGGAPDYKIDVRGMYPDLRAHAEQLNDLGAGMSRAVQEQLKGERFKAELITNVSHDLKTPLTSIISYVDLLKKTGIQDPSALEYIEVLERKSQRLKKLTEDLVEASKASTGSLTVVKEKLGFTQLLSQALGEYEEKLAGSGLETVLSTPDHELYVEADGRHLWRVIDNLLGNCAKYAMPGTRVYVDVKAWDSQVCLSVKNISKGALNIPAEQLMERFVRGDESRATEGSGLGLSIARSLTELQGGAFRIDIDGDLFKAVVIFPEYKEPIPLPEGAIKP